MHGGRPKCAQAVMVPDGRLSRGDSRGGNYSPGLSRLCLPALLAPFPKFHSFSSRPLPSVLPSVLDGRPVARPRPFLRHVKSLA